MFLFSSDQNRDRIRRHRRAQSLLRFIIPGLALLPNAISFAAASPDKPNILLFIADDWGRHASCYRDSNRSTPNDVIQTPNIDRIARNGVLFQNAFYNIASCVESRASIATGCYFWRLGKEAFHRADAGWTEKNDPGSALPGFGNLLQPQNYFLSTWGKTLNRHWFPGEVLPGEEHKHRYGQWVPTQPDRATAQKEIEEIIRDSVREMLAKRKRDRPFCHLIGPIGAHRPFTKGTGRNLWGINAEDLTGKMPASLPDVPESRIDMADTLGEVLATDLYVEWIVDELRKAGQLNNTLLVLTGDNGIGMPRAKANVYDLGVRAPLIVHWPNGISKSGRVVEDFVSVVDLAPTFLEAAGLTIPKEMDGRSLIPLLKSEKAGAVDPTRDHVVVGRERHDPNGRPGRLPYPVRAIRIADFLYVRNFKPDRWPCGDPASEHFPTDPSERGSGTIEWIVSHREHPLFLLNYGKRPGEELYDLRKDPDEVKNVADDPKYAHTRKTLSERLLQIMRRTKDPRLTDAFDKPPYYRGPSNSMNESDSDASTDRSDPDCLAHISGAP